MKGRVDRLRVALMKGTKVDKYPNRRTVKTEETYVDSAKVHSRVRRAHDGLEIQRHPVVAVFDSDGVGGEKRNRGRLPQRIVEE
jgi:hypothetical protein